MATTKVELGREVKDKITGYQGIAVCRHEFLTGCARISVQPPKKEDGTLPDECTFDEPMLEVVGNGILPPPPSKKEPPGGPHNLHMPKSQSYSR